VVGLGKKHRMPSEPTRSSSETTVTVMRPGWKHKCWQDMFARSGCAAFNARKIVSRQQYPMLRQPITPYSSAETRPWPNKTDQFSEGPLDVSLH
jgi:hypothetical protein